MFVVVGTTTVDLFISGVEQMPRFEGDEFTVNSLSFCRRPLGLKLGGNGANTASALGGLGAAVTLCSAAGPDFLGEQVARWLEAKGVDLRGLVRHTAGTATNTTAVDDHLNRVSFYYPGAFPVYSFADIPADVLSAARVVLVTGYPLLPGLRPSGYAALFAAAKRAGALTALDIGPALGDPLRTEELRPLLPLVDYLFTNEYELSVCTGEAEAAIEVGAAQLRQAGAGCVVVKCGARGAFLWNARQTLNAPSFDITVENNIGAGDAFNAGFLYAVRQGVDHAGALRYGNATAAVTIGAEFARADPPTLAQVEALLQR